LGTSLGNGFYNIRLAIASKGKGKSGGAMVVSYVKVTRNTVYLSSIFDKSEKSTVTDKELEQIFSYLPILIIPASTLQIQRESIDSPQSSIFYRIGLCCKI